MKGLLNLGLEVLIFTAKALTGRGLGVIMYSILRLGQVKNGYLERYT